MLQKKDARMFVGLMGIFVVLLSVLLLLMIVLLLVILSGGTPAAQAEDTLVPGTGSLFTGGSAVATTTEAAGSGAPEENKGAPIADFSFHVVEDAAGYASRTVQFVDCSTGSITAFSWDFGDGNTSSERNPSHSYPRAGTYVVNLTVAGPQGVSIPNIKVVTAPGPETTSPTADFSAHPSIGTGSLTVVFTDISTGRSITNWAWDFENDGAIDTVQRNPIHTYSKPGTYTVRLVVTGIDGTDSVVKNGYIVVREADAAPIAAFSADATTGDAPFLVHFADLSSASGPLLYVWDFENDGIVDSTEREPFHTYASGVYSVRLTVTCGGMSDSSVKTRYISVDTPPAPPDASFTADTVTGPSPLTVQFSDASSGSIATYTWDFGDGGTSPVSNPSHTYLMAGTYTVTLTVSGPGGSDSETRTSLISVTEPPDPAPEAAFDAYHYDEATNSFTTCGYVPFSVKFVDRSIGQIHENGYAWDFGDGTTSQEQSPVHLYSAPGNYSVTHTVTGSAGSDSVTMTGLITVMAIPAAPVADFTVRVVDNPPGTTSGPLPLSVLFTDASTGTVTDYLWDYGDGFTSTLQSAVHVYKTPGTYSVRLTATNPGGSDEEFKTDLITVHDPLPVAGFALNRTSGVAPLAIRFTDLSTGSITAYAWTFGDGGSSTLDTPTHVFEQAGTYTVSLVVSGSGGSSLPASQQVEVA